MKQKPDSYSTTNSDALTRYLDEIGRGALLTQEQEISLSKRIAAGDDEARTRMITSNLRLVVTIAKGFGWCPLHISDLIAAGNIGLMKAADRYDASHGTRFSTYAAFWIKQHIRRAIEHEGRTVRLPTHIHEKAIAIHRAESAILGDGLSPTPSRIAKQANLPEKTVNLVRVATLPSISIDAPREQDDGSQSIGMAETLGATSADDPSASAESSDLLRRLALALPTLDHRSRQIIIARFGLDGEKPRTLADIGDSMHLSRERIRQLANIAMADLHTILNNRMVKTESQPQDPEPHFRQEACAA